MQDSRNALNRSRTGKNPFFLFIRPDFWTDLNACRQRLLFARQLTQRKCSLRSQGTTNIFLIVKGASFVNFPKVAVVHMRFHNKERQPE